MAERTVNIGVMTYVAEGGLANQFALRGAVVNVDESDLERFDRFNGPVEKSKARPARRGKEGA